MARYYFHLHECGTLVADDEGRDVYDAASLRTLAITEAREIISAEAKTGIICLSCRIEVMDGAQRLVLSLPFTDAVEVKGVHPNADQFLPSPKPTR